VGRACYTPDTAELCTYEPPQSPYDDQDDIQELTDHMDIEWDVYYDLSQNQDNFDPAAGGDATAELAERGRACVRVCRPSSRVGSAGAGSRQATSRAQRKRRMQSAELKGYIHQEKLEELGQTTTIEELHCVQRRYCQQRCVVPAKSKDGYVEETAAPRGGDDMAD
jgi:hypothetical protein